MALHLVFLSKPLSTNCSRDGRSLVVDINGPTDNTMTGERKGCCHLRGFAIAQRLIRLTARIAAANSCPCGPCICSAPKRSPSHEKGTRSCTSLLQLVAVQVVVSKARQRSPPRRRRGARTQHIEGVANHVAGTHAHKGKSALFAALAFLSVSFLFLFPHLRRRGSRSASKRPA